MSRPVRPAGERGLLIDCRDLGEVLGLASAIREQSYPGVIEVVPAATTVLLTLSPTADAQDLAARVAELEPSADTSASGAEHTIGVRYDGEDLAAVAAHLGVEVSEVIARHTGATYTVAFGGFAPGFAYLVDDHVELEVPRRPSPRTRIPAGAVGLAGIFSGIYPRESPGGWQLIGTTDEVLFDPERKPSALLQSGDTVRFADLALHPELEPEAREAPPAASAERDGALRIVRPGLRALVQDRGRPAAAGIGAPPSGALDQPALRLANRLVGNEPHAPAIEVTMGGLELEALAEVTLAVTGARVDIRITRASGARTEVHDQRAVALSPGDRLSLGAPEAGVRSLVAVRGGLDAGEVADSQSTDTLSGIGPGPLAAEDVLAVGERIIGATADPVPWGPPPGDELEVPVIVGPRQEWFTPESLALLLDQPWTVTPASDRVGMRLAGERPLERSRDAELPSEGVVTGSLQVPPEGHPVLFLNDHPVTGGYPVIGVVVAAALPALAQVRAGTVLRFTAVGDSPEECS